MDTYEIVRDERSGKLYLDDAGGLVRTYETVVEKGSKTHLLAKYADATDVSRAAIRKATGE